MRAEPDTAFRFAHPDLDPDAQPGLGLSPVGAPSMIGGDGAIRQSLLMLISTSPGERVMRPEYGCNLRRILFNPNDDSTAGLALHYVRQAVTRWEPRIQILKLQATRDEAHPSRLIILLEYRVRASLRTDAITIPIDLAGAP
jgi:phage baseplate assembly protein W